MRQIKHFFHPYYYSKKTNGSLASLFFIEEDDNLFYKRMRIYPFIIQGSNKKKFSLRIFTKMQSSLGVYGHDSYFIKHKIKSESFNKVEKSSSNSDRTFFSDFFLD